MDIDKSEQKDIGTVHENNQKNIGASSTIISHENLPEVKDNT